ncbi:hypothetical protein ACSQ67_023207 [Phaseolus vulgaris]
MPIEREFLEKPLEEKVDASIKGKIAPKCWEVFIDITKRCVMYEPDERPTMGEVEVQLEHALSLQEQADITNTNGDYILFSTTVIHPGAELKLEQCFGETSSSRRQYPTTVIEELCHQFSLTDLRKSTNNFDQNTIIGRGKSGKVYKGCLQHNDASEYAVAIKRFQLELYQALGEFKTEIELLCQLCHPNCVSHRIFVS